MDHEQTGANGPMARVVPLVRTEGKQYASGSVWSPEQMLREPRLLREFRDQTARTAEVAFGLGAPLYFYVGHACPDFGIRSNTWVFVFAADCFDREVGTMTHFDTGGFHLRKIHLEPELHDEEDRRSYVDAHKLPSLVGWQAAFHAWVEEHFDSPKAYVLGGRAKKEDPRGRLLHPGNERRAWTWELQLHADHDIRDGLVRLWLFYLPMVKLKQLIRRQPAPERRRWRQALSSDRLRTPPATPSESPHVVCRLAEEEIASWL